MLIDSSRMCWDTDKLEQVFLPRDVEIIIQIPLSTRQPSDRLIWIGTAKSAYHLLLHERQRSLESSRWRPPDLGIYKVNIGICMDSNSMKVGVGILFEILVVLWQLQCSTKWRDVMINSSFKLLWY